MNWWSNELDYPGPREVNPNAPLTWKILIGRKNFDRLQEAAEKAAEALNKYVEIIEPIHTIYDEMTYAERREYALRCVKERNTGPRSKRTFNHRGKRIT